MQNEKPSMAVKNKFHRIKAKGQLLFAHFLPGPVFGLDRSREAAQARFP
jgi:hypothetical protein